METQPSIELTERTRTASDVCVNLLGELCLVLDGKAVEIPEGSKRLLAFVAMSGGRVERRRAAGTLWPENNEMRAAGNLRSALWRINTLGRDVLAADKAALWLCPDASIDVDVMSRWAERVITGHPTPDDLCHLGWRSELVELLPGWYDDWAVFERERVRQLLLHALEALSRQLVTARRCAEAVIVATTAVAAEPLRESAHRVLIESHLAEGNLMEARRAYETYRSLVKEELGVAPGLPVRELTAAWANTRGGPPQT